MKIVTNLCSQIRKLKQVPGNKLLIQKLQQKIDKITATSKRQASDKQN